MSLTKILAVLLAALAFVACEEEPDTPLAHLYPIDYINDPLDFDGDTLDVIHHYPSVIDSGYYVVSNKRDFDRYFSEGKHDVDIDFDANNAVIINGTSNYGVAFAKVRIDETTDGNYRLDVFIKQNMLCVMERWCIVYPVPKSMTYKNTKCNAHYVRSY